MKALQRVCYGLGLLFCILSNTTSYAQVVYPVIVNTNLRAPYSLNLSDYAAPGYDRIMTNLYMSDITKVNYPVKLRLVIRGEGGVTLTTLPGQEVGPIYLNGGQTTTLTGSDINGLFNPDKLQFSGISIQQYRQNSALPEGLYQFQFEVIDYNINVPISNSQIGFSTAWLILNDPPLINQPDRDATIVPLPQQNILFQWTPRHTGSPNSAFTTVYDLQMVEIYPAGRNPNDAMLTSPVIFEKTLYSTSYNYTLADPYLFPGKWYAFRVRAHDVDGRDFFKNQGYSEVYRFYYGGPCVVPANIKVTDVDPTSAIVSWDTEPTHNTTEIQYKEQTGSNWKKITSYSSSELIEKLTPKTNYVFKLSGACANNTSLFSDELNYTTTGGSSGMECDLPVKESVKATAVTLTDVQISWLTEEWFTNYIFRYRELGASQFIEIPSAEASILLRPLDVDKIYEYQIRYLCRTGDWVEGGYNTFTVTVPPDILTGGGTGDCFAPLDITQEVKEDLTVYISWPKDKDAKSYMVYWKQDVAATSWFSQEVSVPKIILDNLIPGTDYVYEVKSVCKSGGLSLASKQGKFNTTYIPVVSKVCNAPKLKAVEIISADEAKLSWAIDPDHNGYIVEYRVQGTKIWIASKETNPFKLISGLDNTLKYEYHVYAFCGQVSSDFSIIDTFSTAGAPAKQFVCGSGQGLLNITNRTPIASLKVGDKFKAADFEVTVTVLTSNGPYNGEASAKVPYLKNSSFIFGMEDVQVNELNQMFAGKIYLKKTNLSIIDPAIAAQINDMLDKVDQGFTSLEGYLATVAQLQDDMNNYISSAEGGNNVGQVVTGDVTATNTATVAITNATQITGTSAGTGQCKLVIAGDDGTSQTLTVAAPSTLKDTKGTIYSIDNNCTATKVAENITLDKTASDLDNLSAKATVTFQDYAAKQKFGFSAWNEEYAKSPTDWAKRYQLLGSTYRVPSKFMEPASVDFAKATIAISDASIDKTKVVFVTGKGVKFTSKSLGGNDYEISIVGGPDKDAQEIYALYPDGASYISFGKVLVPAYKHKKRTLVLVPVNGASTDETKVASTLNKIYNPYGVEWEVKTDANFVDNSWDNNGVEGMQVEGSGTFSTLTGEMAALNQAYIDAPRAIDPTNIYLFVLKKAETAGVDGDMPRAKQFGYLFTDNNSADEIAVTAAHEVGHGLFLLRHIYDGYDMNKGTLSDNLMDNPLGENLAKLQWDVMHDPGIVLGVFDKDEDAMASSTKDNKFKVKEYLRLLRYLCLDKTNKIKLPLNETAAFPCSWITPSTGGTITVGNKLYSKIVVTKSTTTTTTIVVTESKLNYQNVQIELGSKEEAANMKNFLDGTEKDIYGVDASGKTLIVNQALVNQKVITDGIDALYVKLLSNQVYFSLTEKERTILDIPIMQWKLGNYYGAYFILYWLQGLKETSGDIKFTDENVSDLILSSTIFNTAFNEAVTKINNGTIYEGSSAEKSRERLNAITENQNCTDADLPDYEEYKDKINCFAQFLIDRDQLLEDGIFNFNIKKEDFVNALGSVAVRFYFVGPVTYNWYKNAVTINAVKWRIYDSFDFIDDGMSSQDLGDWKRDVFSVSPAQASIVSSDDGYVEIENENFVSLYDKISGKKNDKDKTLYDFNVITKTIKTDAITIKGFNVNKIDYDVIKK